MPAPICPRCDYDLSGLVATWTSSCPMQATCSECGLTFDCANVLSPRMLGPGWSYEHGLHPSANRWRRTSVISLNPWSLCVQLRIDHIVRPARLLQFACLWLLLVHALTVAGRIWVATYSSGPFTHGLSTNWLDRAMDGLYDDRLGALGTLLVPFAGTATIAFGPGGWSALPIFPVFMLTFIPTLLMPAWMLILGTTLEQARVRRAHLLRGLAYALPGAGIWALGICVALGGAVWAGATFLVPWMRWDLLMGAVMLGFPVYHALWWWCFIRRYLRLRHALATVLLMMIMSGLVIVIVGTWISIKNGSFW